jgi:hypothetical protein
LIPKLNVFTTVLTPDALMLYTPASYNPPTYIPPFKGVKPKGG